MFCFGGLIRLLALVVAIPIFQLSLADRAVRSTLFWVWLYHCASGLLFLGLRFSLDGSFELVTLAASLLLSLRGVSQSFLASNRFADTSPVFGHGVLACIGFSKGGRLFCDFLGWVFCFSMFIGGCAFAWLQLVLTAILAFSLLVGTGLFLFSIIVLLSFLMFGLVSGWLGLNWGFGPNFPFNSRKVHIILTIVGWGQSFVLHGVPFIS